MLHIDYYSILFKVSILANKEISVRTIPDLQQQKKYLNTQEDSNKHIFKKHSSTISNFRHSVSKLFTFALYIIIIMFGLMSFLPFFSFSSFFIQHKKNLDIHHLSYLLE